MSLALGLLLSGAPLEAQSRDPIEGWVGSALGFSGRDLRRLERGRVVTRILPSHPQELAVAGIVRVPVGSREFRHQIADLPGFLQGRTIALARAVSEPATAADFREVTLPEEDVEDLEHCAPGDCRVKLSAAWIQRFRSLDWSGSLPRDAVDAGMRDMLVETAQRFRAGRPLEEYADKRAPLAPRAAFRDLVERSPWLLQFFPDFRSWILDYPSGAAGTADGSIVWMEERFGLKPVISLNHVAVHRQPRGGLDALFVIEQLYGTHYFEASASMVAFAESSAPEGSWFIYLRHHRFDDRLNAAQWRLIESQIRTYVEDLVTERASRLRRPG